MHMHMRQPTHPCLIRSYRYMYARAHTCAAGARAHVHVAQCTAHAQTHIPVHQAHVCTRVVHAAHAHVHTHTHTETYTGTRKQMVTSKFAYKSVCIRVDGADVPSHNNIANALRMAVK